MNNLNGFYKILNVDTVEDYLPFLNTPLLTNIRLSDRIFSYFVKNSELRYKIRTVKETLDLMAYDHKKRPNLEMYLWVLERSLERNENNLWRIRQYLDENYLNFKKMIEEIETIGKKADLAKLYTDETECGKIVTEFFLIPKSHYIMEFK